MRLKFVFLLIYGFLFSQNAVIHYEFRYRMKVPDEKQKQKIKNDNQQIESKYFDNAFDLVGRDSKTNAFTIHELIVNNDRSLFTFREDLYQGEKLSLTRIASKTLGRSTTDIKTGQVLQERTFEGNDFLISFDKKPDWKITQDTLRIGKYLCYKATAYKKMSKGSIISVPVTAWFTPDIPIQAGPLEFSGLPGLIIMLQYDFYTFLFKDIEIDNSSVKEIPIPKKGTKVTEDEFLEYVKKKF